MKYIRIFAQVMLVIIFTMVLSVVFAAISPQTGKDFLDNLVTGIPFCDVWVDLLSQYKSFDIGNITDVYIQCFFEATAMGICMNVCKKVTQFFHVTRILPFGEVLVTFVGILVGSLLCSTFGDESGLSLILIGLIVIYGLLIMVSSILPIHKTLSNILSLADILLIIINSLVAVILTGYIAALFLYMDGSIAFSVLISTAVLSIISLLILYTVDGIKD